MVLLEKLLVQENYWQESTLQELTRPEIRNMPVESSNNLPDLKPLTCELQTFSVSFLESCYASCDVLQLVEVLNLKLRLPVRCMKSASVMT